MCALSLRQPHTHTHTDERVHTRASAHTYAHIFIVLFYKSSYKSLVINRPQTATPPHTPPSLPLSLSAQTQTRCIGNGMAKRAPKRQAAFFSLFFSPPPPPPPSSLRMSIYAAVPKTRPKLSNGSFKGTNHRKINYNGSINAADGLLQPRRYFKSPAEHLVLYF